MPAFQLSPCSAAMAENGKMSVTIVQVAGPGLIVTGEFGVGQLLQACLLALGELPDQGKEEGE